MENLNKVRTISVIIIICSVILVLSACTFQQVPELEQYKGKVLHIGVIGTPPEVREDNVLFKHVSFDHLNEQIREDMDAILVMEDQLDEAAKSQYTDIYAASPIPFYFVSAAEGVPFIEKEIPYGEEWAWMMGRNYITGIQNDSTTTNPNWEITGYGLYNDIKNDKTIAGTYSLLFDGIEGITQRP